LPPVAGNRAGSKSKLSSTIATCFDQSIIIETVGETAVLAGGSLLISSYALTSLKDINAELWKWLICGINKVNGDNDFAVDSMSITPFPAKIPVGRAHNSTWFYCGGVSTVGIMEKSFFALTKRSSSVQ
jgi:hypothetical protein